MGTFAGVTTLHMAVEAGRSLLVEKLLGVLRAEGLRTQLVVTETTSGLTVLDVAAMKGYGDVVQQILQSIPSEVLQRGQDQGDIRALLDTEDKCAICLETMAMSKQQLLRTRCGHIFHEDCFSPWVKTKHGCPTCRRFAILGDIFHEECFGP